jgi:putative membrane protein
MLLSQNNPHNMEVGSTDQSGTGQGNRRLVQGLLLWYGLFWIWLAIEPVDRRDWLLENLLSLTLVAVLVLTYRRYQFSRLSYGLIALFLTLHAIGAHYTYAEVPFGFWLKDLFALSRNPFDRIAHFAYGALLVYPLRELLVRLAGLRGFWASFLSVSTILAQSGFFEVAEAVVAVLVSPELGNLYLGAQGDEWDAQKDMAAALTGALLTMCISFAVSWFPGRDIHE